MITDMVNTIQTRCENKQFAFWNSKIDLLKDL